MSYMSEDKTLIALAGNPNSGKTTAFNKYTGARQHVGNYPGITVEKKEGTAHLDGKSITLVDLPGTYSLTAYSLEEVVARKVLAEERPGAVINVVNAGVLERNLYLTVQLLELGIPVVLSLNMMDEARAAGLSIDVAQLEKLTGIRAVPTVARSGEGLDEALRTAVRLAREGDEKARTPLEISYGPDIDAILPGMTDLIAQKKFLTDLYPARWTALKYLERDGDIMDRGKGADPETSAALEKITEKLAAHLAGTLKTYPEAIIADYRYGFIASVLKQGVLTGADEMQARIAYSDKMDKVLTNRLFGPLILVGVLYAMYWLTFSLGEYPAGWLESFFGFLNETADAHMREGMLKSLVMSGVIDGVGGVMSFVPLIAIMFLLISFFEDSGYMARMAYMMDRVFRFFGLHGASVMPFIVAGGIAGGCAIPGVMATRTLRSPRERLATILCAPFMSCGAKIPVFLLLVGVFFEQHQAAVMMGLTLAGWVFALLVARLLRSTVIRGEATPFVMELPPYRLPALSGLIIHTWERVWGYMKKAGTIILAISVLVWVGMTFPGLPEDRAAFYAEQKAPIEQRLAALQEAGASEEEIAGVEEELTGIADAEAAETLRSSAAGRVGTAMEVFTKPAGFDWRTNIAILAGIAAKEVVVSTLGTAYSLGEVDAEDSGSLADRIKADPDWSVANGTALLLFTLLYSPCVPTLAVIKSESGRWRWMWFSLFFNLALAYTVAVIAYQAITAFI